MLHDKGTEARTWPAGAPKEGLGDPVLVATSKLKRDWIDHDGGYQVWFNPNQRPEDHLHATAPDTFGSDSAKRAKTVQEKQLHWKDALTAAEGQKTVLLAELSMAEYHLNELQSITNTVANQVEEKRAALQECRAHVAKMYEAVKWLSVLEQGAADTAPHA